MERIARLPKPEGFFDPKAPAGTPTPPERDPDAPAMHGARRVSAAALRLSPTAGEPLELLELGSRVQRQPALRRQLPRVQHLRRRERKNPRLARVGGVPRRPGRRVGARQSAVHVGGADPRPDRLRHAGRPGEGQRRAIPRRPHLRHHRRQEAEAGCRGADLPRIAHAHARGRSERQRQPVHLRIRHRCGPAGRGARGMLGQDPKEDPNTALFSIDVIQVPLASPEKARIVNRPRIFADAATGEIAGLWQGGDHGPGTQKTSRHQSMSRHHRLPGNRPGGGRLLGQRHPDGHLRSGASGPARPGRRQELRLLALGDVQQRRHEGHLHRRMGRRLATPLPRHRSAHLGRRRDLRHRRSQAALRQLLQDAGGANRAGELRGAQRRARFRCPGATSWSRRGIRAASRCSISPTRRIRSRSRSSIAARSTPSRSSPAATGRRIGTTATSTARRSPAASTCSG